MNHNEDRNWTENVDALARWKTGHHALFVIIQGLILIHKRLTAALVERRYDVAREAVAVATELFWATAALFRFAGNFSREQYEAEVRPSMMPPYVSEKFSGLYSADHTFFLRLLRSFKPLWKELPEDLRAQHRFYLWALHAAYESHGMVCEQFVGNRPSLLNLNAERPAPAVIRGVLKPRTMEFAGRLIHRETAHA